MQFHEIPNLRNPVALFAFTGWNDAGEAATGALSHLLGIWAETSTLIAEIDPEEYFDFQVNRPHVYIDDSKIRRLTWPTVKVWGITTPSLPFDLGIINGTEPSMRWTTFATEIIDVLDDLEVDLAITLGSLIELKVLVIVSLYDGSFNCVRSTLFFANAALTPLALPSLTLDNLLTKNWDRETQQWIPTPPEATTFDVNPGPTTVFDGNSVEFTEIGRAHV